MYLLEGEAIVENKLNHPFAEMDPMGSDGGGTGYSQGTKS